LINTPEVAKAYKKINEGYPAALLLTGLGPNPFPPSPFLHFASEDGSLESAARNLYTKLHHLDGSGFQTIMVESFPDNALGAALNNRLTRAAEQ
jgi:hypothetical protein